MKKEYKGYNISISEGYYKFTNGPNLGRPLHCIIWEEYNGSVPEGHVIHHKDEIKLHNDIENLECLTWSEHSKLHNLGKRVSEATKKRISKSKKGKKISEEHKKKISKRLKGRKFSKKHKKNLSMAKSGGNHYLFGKHMKEETKKKISKSLKGKKVAKETKEKISEYRKGKNPTEETKKRISESLKLYWQKHNYKQRQMGNRMNYKFHCKECGKVLTLRSLHRIFICPNCDTTGYHPGDKFIGRVIGINKFDSKILYEESLLDRNVYAVPMAEDMARNLCMTKLEFIQKVKNGEIGGVRLLEEKDFVRKGGWDSDVV
jgi:predicted RNA-binding Zn-ribbon protein involved in translation (DUF1610 family)